MTKMWQEIWQQPETLQKCIGVNISIVSRIAKEIKDRGIKFVYMAARGTSDHAAVYAKYVFEITTGLPVALAASSVITLYNHGIRLDNALVIGISQSGEAADVLEVIREGNRHGALTVGITNNSYSPIAGECAYHLNCAAGEEKSVAATKTFTAQMLLLALLASEVSGDSNLKTELQGIPEKLSHTYEISDTIKEKVNRYRFMNECFVLARGVNYAISLEAALKIQETTYVRAKAFAASDFQHGPIAMVEKDIPTMLIAPDGPSYKDMLEMAQRLKLSQTELIIISNKSELSNFSDCFFPIPDTSNDIISPFYNIVTVQMFACQLALTKGLNPDSPRGLSKITVTK